MKWVFYRLLSFIICHWCISVLYLPNFYSNNFRDVFRNSTMNNPVPQKIISNNAYSYAKIANSINKIRHCYEIRRRTPSHVNMFLLYLEIFTRNINYYIDSTSILNSRSRNDYYSHNTTMFWKTSRIFVCQLYQ